MNHSVYWQKWSKKEHKISICCNGGWLRLSGLVKHDDSDTAQRGSQVHALIKYAARQVSSILTSLDAFTLDFFYFGAITQLQLHRHCNYRLIACSQISWQGDRVIVLQESNGNHGFIPVLQNGCLQKRTLWRDTLIRLNCWGLENNCW